MTLDMAICFAVVVCCMSIGIYSALAWILFETLPRKCERWIGAAWIAFSAVSVVGTVVTVVYDFKVVS